MNICLVIATLGPGGAERVLSTMANYWTERGHIVTLVTLETTERDFYHVDPRAHRVGLGLIWPSATLFEALRNNFCRVRELRRAIRACKPDVIVSFLDQTNVLTLLAAAGLRIPVVVSERIDPHHQPLSAVWRWMRARTYPRAGRIVVQTERAGRYFRSAAARRLAVLPNPVLLRPGHAAEVLPRPVVVGIGRLEYQKGFDLLLRAFARIASSWPEWTLVLVGEGSLKTELERLASTLGLRDKVRFMGTVEVTELLLMQIDVFVLPSRFEGFPNALCEAMAAGRAVIASDCPSGPGEIIQNGENGLLVPIENVSALANVLERLVGDPALRLRLGRQARNVAVRFDIESVMARWDRMLSELTAEGTKACRITG